MLVLLGEGEEGNSFFCHQVMNELNRGSSADGREMEAGYRRAAGGIQGADEPLGCLEQRG